jgi:hypothetical protein
MSNPSQDIELARAAEELQNNSTFKLVMARLEVQYTEQWKASTDVATREALHAKASALGDFATELRILVDGGTRAKIEQENRKLVDR